MIRDQDEIKYENQDHYKSINDMSTYDFNFSIPLIELNPEISYSSYSKFMKENNHLSKFLNESTNYDLSSDTTIEEFLLMIHEQTVFGKRFIY